MADGGGDSQDLTGATHEPRECMACRGTGRVISNLGGTPGTVECPWCSGSGIRPAEIDAQAPRRAELEERAQELAEGEEDPDADGGGAAPGGPAPEGGEGSSRD